MQLWKTTCIATPYNFNISNNKLFDVAACFCIATNNFLFSVAIIKLAFSSYIFRFQYIIKRVTMLMWQISVVALFFFRTFYIQLKGYVGKTLDTYAYAT